MLVTAAAATTTSVDCTNQYSDQIVYESEWTESIPIGISWLNLLTAESIPEETDAIDVPHSSERTQSESNCSSSSSSSIESCYVVLEIQRPRSTDEISSKHDDDDDEVNEEENKEKDEDEEEEEEEIEEEIEELHFAQMNRDDHNVHYDQLTMSLTTETPMKENVAECQQEQLGFAEEFAQVTQPVILETPNDLLFHKAKALSRFTKRMKAISYLSNKEQQFSTSSDDESLSFTKLKTIRKINGYHPTAISSVAAEQPSTMEPSNCSSISTASLDSIEDKCLPSSPVRTRITTTFSNLSSKRSSNPVQSQRINPTMGTTTLTRTFAFDRTCMEKYVRGKGQINEPIEFQVKSIYEPPIEEEEQEEEEEELPSQIFEHSETSPSSTDRLNSRSFNNIVPTSFYIVNEPNVIDDSEGEHHSSTASNPSKSSSILSSMKKYARTISSEYRLSHHYHQNNPTTEPTLLQVKYLDGRRSLRNNDQVRESLQKSQTLSDSISSRLNRLGLNKVSSTQDLTSPTTSFHMSYRKRMINRFRTFIENNSFDDTSSSSTSSSSSQVRPWQHKTISELYNERKGKLHH